MSEYLKIHPQPCQCPFCECERRYYKAQSELAAPTGLEANMINTIEWFKEKGFTFDDKITIADVIALQQNAKLCGMKQMAEMVYDEGLFHMGESMWRHIEKEEASNAEVSDRRGAGSLH